MANSELSPLLRTPLYSLAQASKARFTGLFRLGNARTVFRVET